MLIAFALAVIAPVGLSRGADAATAGSTVPLAPVGAVPTPPAGSVPTGQLPGGTPLHLSVVLRSSDPKGLEASALAVSTPGSPQYRRYLSPQQVQERFGPSPSATAAVDAYLSSRGLSLGPTLADGLVVTATGAAGVVSGALHTGIMTYRQRTGRVVYANTSQLQMPSSVAPGVASVIGVDDTVELEPRLSLSSPPRAPTTATAAGVLPIPSPVSGAARPCPAASKVASGGAAYTADQVAGSYGFTSAYQSGELGRGVTVGIFELAGYSKTDLDRFESCYGIDAKIVKKKVDGGAKLSDGTIESELDIEAVASLAPKAKVLVYEAPNTDTGVLDAYGLMESDNRAQVISTSWGVCEPLAGALTSAENTIFEGMTTQGQTVVAASGDSGSEDCFGSDGSRALEVDDPASQPSVLGVGGTDMTSDGSPPTETVWNNGSGASGGGSSHVWGKPSWQTGPGVTGVNRDVPDVSASADPRNGYVELCTVSRFCKMEGGGWFAIGGTSAAAPLWAALFALADQGLASPIGFANPTIYSIAASKTTHAFNDITAGDNDFTGTNGGEYPATSGYDLATGWGSPAGARLIPFLRG